MTYEMVFNENEYYESVDNASDMIAAYKNGENIIVHFPEMRSYSCFESFCKVLGYESAHDSQPGKFFFHSYSLDDYIQFGDNQINQNGKLIVPIYVD